MKTIMSLLQVVIDFDVQKLTEANQPAGLDNSEATLPLQILFDSLTKFLAAFQMQ
jgi:hypothetical protein